jgi:hypothetical protein
MKVVSTYNIVRKNKCNIRNLFCHFLCNRLPVSPEHASNSNQTKYLISICLSIFFPFGIFPDGTFHCAVRDGYNVFRKKNSSGVTGSGVSNTCYTRRQGMRKIAPRRFLRSFLIYYFPKLCCIRFKTRLRLFFRQHSISF